MKIYIKSCGIAITLIISLLLFFNLLTIVEAAKIPTGQNAGFTERVVEEKKKKEAVEKALITGKEEAEIKEKGEIAAEIPAGKPKVAGTAVLINKIEVTGVTALKPRIIRRIVKPYEGKELSLEDFRNIADLITDEYRKKGYVTSIAYLPPQKITEDTLRIDIAEGIVGDINLEGNRYFSSRILLRYIDMKKDELFNYDVLRRNINYINEHPDRNAKVVLARGKRRGETDININVEDHLPIHVSLGYNNYNSRYLGRDKYIVEVKATNLTGNDDIATAEMQLAEAGRYQLYSGRYLLPINNVWEVGAYYIYINQKLGKEVKNLDIKGKGNIVSIYSSHRLIRTDNFSLNMSPGFDYKDIENEILGVTISEDRMRIAKVGFDADITDWFAGRTILTQEFDFGIPGILDGLESTDSNASRVDSGGSFFKSVTNAAHIRPLPNSMSLIIKGVLQLTSDNLVSSEQFNIGGISTVRGYPVSDQVGDNGYTVSLEFYIPPYFLPKTLKVPFSKSTFFDSLRFMGFFDWGYVSNNNPQVGESKDEALYSVGPAVRFDVPGRLSVSFDYGIGLGSEGSDSSSSKYYVEAKLFF